MSKGKEMPPDKNDWYDIPYTISLKRIKINYSRFCNG